MIYPHDESNRENNEKGSVNMEEEKMEQVWELDQDVVKDIERLSTLGYNLRIHLLQLIKENYRDGYDIYTKAEKSLTHSSLKGDYYDRYESLVLKWNEEAKRRRHELEGYIEELKEIIERIDRKISRLEDNKYKKVWRKIG